MPKTEGRARAQQALGLLWRSYSQGTNRHMITIAIVVGVVNLVVKAGGAAKDIAVADRFGTAAALDAFFVALMVVVFMINTIAAAYAEAFLPVFIRVRERDGAAMARRFLGRATWFSLLLCTAAAGLIELFSRPALRVVASRLPAEAFVSCQRLLHIVLPALIVSGLSSVWAAALNASGRQPTVAAAPIAAPLLTLVLLFVPGGRWLGTDALAIGVSVGAFIEALLLGAQLWRCGHLALPVPGRLDPNLRVLLRQCAPLIFASLLGTSSSVVDQAMAAMLPPGSVSALNYGGRVIALVSGVATVALSSGVFPQFAELVARRDHRAARRLLFEFTGLAWVAVAVVTIPLFVFSAPLVALLFERGSFTASDTAVVSYVQRCFLLHLPFSVSGMVAVRLLNATGRNHLLGALGVLTAILNAAANYVLMRFMGVAGIALSTSLVFVVSFSFAVFLADRGLRLLLRSPH
jgi:putative peptidoglycan lipid II flippase